MHSTLAPGDLYQILQVDPRAHPAVITAAYRALARLLHPDHSQEATEAPMARLNRAYEVLRDPERRQAYDRTRAAVTAPSAPPPSPLRTPPPPARPGSSASQLRYGRYQGWSLDQLVRHDPDYLRWLARHTSGRHHRAEIERLLNDRHAAVAAR